MINLKIDLTEVLFFLLIFFWNTKSFSNTDIQEKCHFPRIQRPHQRQNIDNIITFSSLKFRNIMFSSTTNPSERSNKKQWQRIHNNSRRLSCKPFIVRPFIIFHKYTAQKTISHLKQIYPTILCFKSSLIKMQWLISFLWAWLFWGYSQKSFHNGAFIIIQGDSFHWAHTCLSGVSLII